MTQEELNRLNEARKLEHNIDILRKASLIVANSPMVGMLSTNAKQGIFYAALELVQPRLSELFADEARGLERKFEKL